MCNKFALVPLALRSKLSHIEKKFSCAQSRYPIPLRGVHRIYIAHTSSRCNPDIMIKIHKYEKIISYMEI
jgi:hypothetical protein